MEFVESPNGLKEVRVDAVISDDPTELDAIADAVVRGCSIRYARITSLRGLIDAIQRHPGAKLAPPAEESGEDWKPLATDSSNSITRLAVYGGEVTDNGNYEQLDIRISLVLRIHFCGVASFDGVRFGGDAWFVEAVFDKDASFRESRFEGIAGFERVSFGWDAKFDDVHFCEFAHFGHVRIGLEAWFVRARFGGYARFEQASFYGDVFFNEARFGGQAWFHGACFAGAISGDLRPCFLRTAKFGEMTHVFPASKRQRWHQLIKNWRSRQFGWHFVRSLGQLQILNRISVLAIIAVPVLAALTAMLKVQFPQWP